MASHTDDARTQPPSPRRLQRAWREGQVPLSQLATAVVALAAGLAVALGGAKSAYESWRALFQQALSNVFADQAYADQAAEVANKGLALALSLWTPVALAAFAMALLMGLAQTRGALRRLMAFRKGQTHSSAARMAPLALGAAGFALVAAALLWSARGSVVHIGQSSHAASLLVGFGKLTSWLLLRLLLVASTWAALDGVWQWWRWRQSLQMSRRELINENRAQEGDAQLRAARQRLGRELAKPGTAV